VDAGQAPDRDALLRAHPVRHALPAHAVSSVPLAPAGIARHFFFGAWFVGEPLAGVLLCATILCLSLGSRYWRLPSLPGILAGA
jgi:hypothetical protein